MTNLDRGGYAALVVVLVISLYLGFTDEPTFNERFANEDGIVENLTAMVLLGIASLCGYRLLKQWNKHRWPWLLGTALFGLLFFFAAGEEISWGQRIFGWESGEFFMERNAQSETNLHNLVVGDTKINKLIFSQLLAVVMVIYMLILPVLYRRLTWVWQLADGFAVPVVKWHHTIVFLLVTVVIVIIPAERKWEVYELAFGLIFFLIFLNPMNQEIFKMENNYS